MNAKDKFTVSKTDKLGLALSGGGFRAALFHLGVLARLAELELLQHVQVLSTVSGGSIIGAMYYLKVKQLLEHKRPDGLLPSAQAYITLVQELEKSFLNGVQKNLRMRALLNPIKNAKMLISDDYSRSDRMSELYNEIFYKPIQDPTPLTLSEWLQDALCIRDFRNVFLKDLKIYPPGTQPGFNLDAYNQAADYKIPILTINATTLNSGEDWTFTASSVGVFTSSSPCYPRLQSSHYPQLRFDDATLSPERINKLNCLTLSDAVAASACVPGLFAPMAIHDLYTYNGEQAVVELVDGGVFDNQGLESLFDQCCTHIICSDACGQLKHDRTPASDTSSVVVRSNDVLMERVRSLIVQDIDDHERRMALKGITIDARFWHLREDFNATSFFPNFSSPPDSSDYDKTGANDGQIFLISAIRTDLDTFADTEAHSLMYDGYCLCDKFLNNSTGLTSTPVNTWNFLNIRTKLDRNSDKVTHCLAVGGDMSFKAFRLMGMEGKILAGGLAIVVMLGIWVGVYQLLVDYTDQIQWVLNTPKLATAILILGLAGWLFSKKLPRPAHHWLKLTADAIRIVRTGNVLGVIYPVAFIGALGSVVACFHVYVIDPVYKRLG
jgi:NTE family protein